MLGTNGSSKGLTQVHVCLSGETSAAKAGLRAWLEEASWVSLADGDSWSAVRAGDAPSVIVIGPARSGRVDPHLLADAVRTGAPVLAVTESPTAEELTRVIKAGARGYVCGGDEQALGVALGALSRGQAFVCAPAEAFHRLRESGPEAQRAPLSLTPREREVLVLMARGHTNRQVAEELGVSPKTIEVYRTRLSDKTGRRRRVELIRLAVEYGLVPPPAEASPSA